MRCKPAMKSETRLDSPRTRPRTEKTRPLLGQLLQPHSRNGLDAVAQQVQHPDRTRLESPEPLDGLDAALHRPAPLLQLLDLPGQVLLVLPLPARPLDSSLQPVAAGRLLRPPGQDTPHRAQGYSQNQQPLKGAAPIEPARRRPPPTRLRHPPPD